MNTVQRIAKNTLALYSGYIISAVLGLILTIIIARTLGDVQFGQYSFVLAFTALFGIFIELGYSTLLIREVARDKSLVGKYFSNVAAIRLVLSIVVFAIMAATINLMDYPGDIQTLVYLFGLSLVLNSFASICRATFRAFEKMEYEFLTVVIETITRVSLGIIIILMGYGLREIAIVFIIASTLNLVISLTICSRKFTKPKLEIDLNFWKQTTKVALPLALISIFSFVFLRIDTVMLSAMRGDAEVGWYSAAYNLVLGLKPIPQLFIHALFPLASALFISSFETLKFVYIKAFKYLLILALPIAVGIMILADYLVASFYGSTFDKSTIILQILAWDVLLFFVYGLLGSMLVSINKQGQMAIVAGMAALVNVILNIVLIPIYGYIGAAIATIITEVGLLGIYFYLVSKHIVKMKLQKYMLSSLIATIAMATSIFLLIEFNLAVVVVIGIVTYLVVLLLTGGLSKEDMGLIMGIFKNPKSTKDDQNNERVH